MWSLFIIEWLFITPPPPSLIWEQYGKMDPTPPPSVVTARVYYILQHQRIFNVPFKNNSMETAAPFNLASQPRDTALIACYLVRIVQILRFRIRVRVRQTVPEFLVNS